MTEPTEVAIVTDLTAALTEPQVALLRVIAEPAFSRRVRPKWRYVETEMRRLGYRGPEVIKTLPIAGARQIVGPSYSTVWYDRHNLQPQSEVFLTMAATLHLPEYSDAGVGFMSFLRACARKIHEAPNDPVKLIDPRIDAAELRTDFGLDEEFIALLPMILQHEPFNIATRVEIPTESSNWAIAIDQHVLDYEDMTELRQYVEHVTETIDREISYLDFSGPIYAGSNFIGVAAQESTTAEVDTKPDSSNNYVSSRITESLKAKSEASSFDLDKLLRLTSELNQNFAQRNPYACHALLRTILDHIPPIFGQRNFDAVAANHSWSRSDKKYIKFLAEFRGQADDVLHRQIGSSPSFIEMEDLPPRARVNALMAEVLRLL
ncbi:hypothetical protein MUY14_40100 [Amycolatopsis sp. FBCC-B4732]|uniref:hypothetical protein n=1 Tax=Amycolatopsis sp. FBCC-B4732 TaxID=3079339 RepID=UPI001FF2327F|nr:hypothetical protein [Amycolatopsis sp. FBCC-B4732]UOX87846.1 hypothetical protein MUY14_40100 [Amycolatopsis sp. FBCC-B4732]